jgi:hypothetical protein
MGGRAQRFSSWAASAGDCGASSAFSKSKHRVGANADELRLQQTARGRFGLYVKGWDGLFVVILAENFAGCRIHEMEPTAR